MDKARHFMWAADAKQFVERQDLLIGIDPVYQQNRYVFFAKYFGHPLCVLGDVGHNGRNKAEWQRILNGLCLRVR